MGKGWDPDPAWGKFLDPDPNIMYLDPLNCFFLFFGAAFLPVPRAPPPEGSSRERQDCDPRDILLERVQAGLPPATQHLPLLRHHPLHVSRHPLR